MRILVRAVTLAGLAGCDPYEPILGATPYLCSDTAPRCPSGYECVTSDEGDEVCTNIGSVPDRPVNCADDLQYEPNDTLATASMTPTTRTFQLTELSICPAGEKDTFALEISDGQAIAIDIAIASDGGPLEGAILNEVGVPVATTMPPDDPVASLHASTVGLVGGRYYVRVAGVIDNINSYSLTVEVSGP